MNGEKIKVVFIGGLANGKIVYEYLKKNKHVSVELGITYPDNTAKSDFVFFPEEANLIKDNSANKYIAEIRKAGPDYVFVAGWSELLHPELIRISKKGTIGFHPSRLPHDRGRSVLAWQIEEGYTETALSMFYYNDLPDCGDLIAQERIYIQFEDTIKDVLGKVSEATNNLMKAYFPLLREGKAPKVVQNINQGNFRRLRTEKDSEIDWNKNSLTIYNKVRAITDPYPGATAMIGNDRFKVWNSVIIDFPFGQQLSPGCLVATLYDHSMVVRTRNGFLLINQFEKIK